MIRNTSKAFRSFGGWESSGSATSLFEHWWRHRWSGCT